jgi:hypothetical protein
MMKILYQLVYGAKKIVNGQAVISATAGVGGEKNLDSLLFLKTENNSFKFEGKYVVVPRPNAATISADKMNGVQRCCNNVYFFCWYF